ncbi:MAG: lysophospholipid acyltransferase family protein [Patescibacteria group bacterium]|jgi:1-acyl-sn-glycerol-3-phosphate acyltransferase
MAYGGFRQILGPFIRNKIGVVEGEQFLPAKPPFILALNHVGFMDGLVLVTYIYLKYNGRRTFYLTNERMWKLWGQKLARNWLGMIPVFDDKRGDSLREAIDVLKRGEIVGIFPEGTRNQDRHNLLIAKTGAARMALATKVPLIPVGLRNNTGHRIGKAFRSLWHKDQKVDINFGPAVDLSEFSNREIDKPLLQEATKKLMQAIGRLCGKNYPF